VIAPIITGIITTEGVRVGLFASTGKHMNRYLQYYKHY
jgi:hypothetical protein